MNLLSKEKSPYLKQHENNPVNWHAWNNETLKKARHTDKLILVSIGYSTCHWCHVMEKESFEHKDVADAMNRSFVNIKVDREERPDVDDYYMDAVHLMGLNGGWPLNCVALPDGRPIWAGTYVPKAKWIETLNQLADLFANDRTKVEEYATRLNNGLKQLNLVASTSAEIDFKYEELNQWTNSLKTKFDQEHGGMNRAPKFPMPDVYRFLLRQYALSGDTVLIDHVHKSAIKMAHAGLFDQIGGGFARYSVDAEWHVPHFEKMLYDNGQLLSLYSELYALNKNERFREIIEQTVDFLEVELKDKKGGFYCGLDADSEGEEGKFYVFKEEELELLVDDDYQSFKHLFQIGGLAHWENGNNVLRLATKYENEPINTTLDNWPVLRNKLYNYRSKRTNPGLDDKIIVSWNALTVIGLFDAYAYLRVQKSKDLAINALNFMLKEMVRDNNLFRVYHTGTTSVSAFLEDYASLCLACLRAFEITQDRYYLNSAELMANLVFEKFRNDKSPLFFATSANDNQVNVRKVSYQDNVIASANALMAESLYKLGHLLLKTDYIDHAKQMVNSVYQSMQKDIEFFSFWARLYQNISGKFFEIVVTGPTAQAMVNEINSWFLPGKIMVKANSDDDLFLAKGKFSDKTDKIYLCEQGVCHSPLQSLEQLKKEIWGA
ncbi:MAG: thioredoxin domain-containing protein [Bacteroidia bacterium]